MRPLILFIVILLSTGAVFAQDDEEFYIKPYHYEQDEQQEPIQSDTLLFYRILHRTTDLYGDITRYKFSFIEFSRRGIPYHEQESSIDGISLRTSNLRILRHLGLEEQLHNTHLRNSFKERMSTHFTSLASTPLTSRSASLFFSGKDYLGGVRATIHQFMQQGWSLSAHIAARGGNGLYVKGVAHNAVDIGLRARKEFSSGDALSMIVTVSLSNRALRSGSTNEAFTLTKDNLYNPTWGYQDGRIRNSRQRLEMIPFFVATYSSQLTTRTNLQLSFGTEWGKTKLSALGWYGASTPRPDNYRVMPSYYTNNDIAHVVESAWIANDSHYTQINWAELYTINAMSNGEARYALEQRVNRIIKGEVTALFNTLYNNIEFKYGLSGRINSNRYYKEIDDLLGAEYLTDVDYYLKDDDSFSLNNQNDLQNPNRQVKAGDRFAYDYALNERSIKLLAGARYQTELWNFELYADIASHAIVRRGYFEKEIYPGVGSLGKSQCLKFSPYTITASASYSFSARNNITLSLGLSESLPYAPTLFLNPQYNNRTIAHSRLQRLIEGEIHYKLRSPKIDLTANAFIESRGNLIETIRAYDDLSTQYCDIVTDNIATLSYGVELASQIRMTRRWRASVAIAAGNYIYSNNPSITHYDDTDNTIVSTSRSLMKNRHLGGIPHISGSATITYLDYSGWAISASLNVAALRYASPSSIRRSERIVAQGSNLTPELYAQFMYQERFNDACTADISVSRWFNIRHSRLSLTLSVYNLLGNKNIVYGGYESSRIRHYRSGAQHIYRPQDNIITYAYPRTIYFVTTWRF